MQTTSKLIVTTPSDREILMQRVFDAPRDLVFDCYTRPELLKRWLHGPEGWLLTHCEIDLRVGGRSRYVWEHRDGRSMGMSGRYHEIDRPGLVVQSEIFDEDWTDGEALGRLTFTERGGRTEVAQLMLYSSRAARDGALSTGMERGMEASNLYLESLLAELVSQRGVA